jgi:hypothetical protein
MKPIARCTLLLLLLVLLLASTAAFAQSTILIGQLYLDNTTPGSGGSPGVDQFDLLNLTGTAGGQGITTDVTFSNMTLSINGGTAVSVASLPGSDISPLYGFETIASGLADGTITSFVLTGSLSPIQVVVNGITEMIAGTFTVSYSNSESPLTTSGSCQSSGTGCPEWDIDVTETPVSSVPEPATLTLYGSGLCFVAWLRRRRSLKA